LSFLYKAKQEVLFLKKKNQKNFDYTGLVAVKPASLNEEGLFWSVLLSPPTAQNKTKVFCFFFSKKKRFLL